MISDHVNVGTRASEGGVMRKARQNEQGGERQEGGAVVREQLAELFRVELMSELDGRSFRFAPSAAKSRAYVRCLLI